MEQARNFNINVTTGTMLRAVLIGLLLVALYYLRELVVLLLTSVVLASSIEPLTRLLLRFKIPRVASVISVFAAIIAAVIFVFYFFLPPLLDDVAGLISYVPKLFAPGSIIGDVLSPYFDFASSVGNFKATVTAKDISSVIRGSLFGSSGILTTAGIVFHGLTQVILVIVISFYLAVQERGIEKFLRIVTPVRQEKYVIDLWNRSQRKIGLWMQGQIILGLLIGVLVYLGLSILGVPYAFLLALLSAFMELIPLFGGLLAMIPGIMVAFAQDGVTSGLIVWAFYLIVHQFENHLLYPLVVNKVVGVPPLLVIISLIIGFAFAGFWGLLLAVPVASAVMEFVNDSEKERAKMIKTITL